MTLTCADVQALLSQGDVCRAVEPLAGDGSARRYYRVRTREGSYALCVGPDRAENAAVQRLAAHLLARGVPVPRVHAHDPARGWLLQDDLGDENLLAARRRCGSHTELVALYRPVLEVLVRLQVDAGADYDPHTGQFAAPYDAALMVAEEGRYFAAEFAAGLCGVAVPDAYFAQMEQLAAEGARAPAEFLLHRDFQSRNIHLTPAGPAIIDFQGCRHGPLAYDVAAIVLDPYAALPASVRAELLATYRDVLAARGVAPAAFDAGWFSVGAFRLLQALGAFAKLGGRFGKPGFLEHAATGLTHLLEHLGEPGRERFPAVVDLVAAARDAWAVSPRRL